MHWDVIITAVVGVATTLIGVSYGSLLARRQQVESWSRDRQVDACAEIVRASMQVYRQLRNLFLNRVTQADLDWVPWTEALAVIDLVGHPSVVEAAHALDDATKKASYAARSQSTAEAKDWDPIREPLEAARLSFINAARATLLVNQQPLARQDPRPALSASPRSAPLSPPPDEVPAAE